MRKPYYILALLPPFQNLLNTFQSSLPVLLTIFIIEFSQLFILAKSLHVSDNALSSFDNLKNLVCETWILIYLF